jgi:uncharacterized membrane protein YdfJ with MMPL/SSD domain
MMAGMERHAATDETEHDVRGTVTNRELLAEMRGLRGEMTARITQVEQVGGAERATLRSDITRIQETAQLRHIATETTVHTLGDRLRGMEQAQAALSALVAPVADYIEDLKQSDARRDKRNNVIRNVLFGTSFVSWLTLVATIVALLKR